VGHLDRAAAAFAAAVRLEPADPSHWVGLGKARLERANVEGAEFAFRNARLRAPHHPAATVALAALLRERGDSAAGEEMLLAALEIFPDDPELRLARAGDLIEDGKFDAALALLPDEPPADELTRSIWYTHRTVIAVQQDDVDAARAMLHQAGPPPLGSALPLAWRRVAVANAAGAEAEAVQAAETAAALIHAPGEQLEARVAASFSLARFWAARDAPARAFGFWRDGHVLLGRTQPFRRDDYAAFVDATLARFDAARLRNGPIAENDDPAPVFIVGMPRSGTTLTEQILAGHHAMFGAGERTALSFSYARLGGPGAGGGESAEGVARVADTAQAKLTHEADRYLRELHALAPDKARVVDKMPGNFRLLGLVGLLIPRARIIHCVRDPRDIGFSIFSRRFMGHHAYAHDLRDLGWYIAQHHRLMAHWTAVLPNPILRVHLHDWMADLPGTLARVLEFLELDYDPACERFFELDREVRTASKAQVRRPVNRAGLGRWRAYADHLLPMIEELIAGGALPGTTKLTTNGTETSQWAQQIGFPQQAEAGLTPTTGALTAQIPSQAPPIPPSSA
jgi:tetratricopeptide (TPR) repeat protein